jgi:hypothetical protein
MDCFGWLHLQQIYSKTSRIGCSANRARRPVSAMSERPAPAPLATNRNHRFLHNRQLRAVAPRRLSGDERGHLGAPVSIPSIGGKLNFTVRSRHGGSTRSMQSRIAAVIAGERHLDGLARQRLRFAREKCLGGKGRLVARTPSPAARVTRSALFEGPPAHPRRRLR